MDANVRLHLQRMLESNDRLSYYERIQILMADCEALRECRKDYWTYEQYAKMLLHTVGKLEREAKKVREDIKHGEK